MTYNFSHTRPTSINPDSIYVINRESGSPKMDLWTENISHAYIPISSVQEDSNILAQLIAKKSSTNILRRS